MDLKEFVKNTLVQIVEGSIEANRTLIDTGASINPVGGYRGETSTGSWSDKDGATQMVKFHVALTNSEKEGASAGIGVLLGGINFGARGSSEEAETSITTVNFEIPLLLPAGKKLSKN